jgi:hypothetical protein
LARPSKQIIAEFMECTVLAVPEFWAITYAGALCSVRRTEYILTGAVNKYPKSVYPTKAYALTTARKLNEDHGTDLFGVVKLVKGN